MPTPWTPCDPSRQSLYVVGVVIQLFPMRYNTPLMGIFGRGLCPIGLTKTLLELCCNLEVLLTQSSFSSLFPLQMLDLHHNLKVLLLSLAPSSLSFIGKSLNTSFAYLIWVWHLLFRRTKLTQEHRPKLLM